MNARSHKLWNRVANVAILGALAVAVAPTGMRAYAAWAQASARSRITPVTRAASAPRSVNKSNPLVRRPPVRAWETSVLEIPSIGVNSVVDQGNADWQLMPGPGHEPRSAGAGSKGNCIIAAHRNMWEATFADLPNVKPGDEITLTTSTGIFTYTVTSSRDTLTHDRAALAQSKDAVLTLYTCVLPFKETRRWVVQATLADAWTQDPGTKTRSR